jgi:DNA-binding winged helix-turn-helix (wHTH) protein
MECLLARLDAAPKPVLSGADVSAWAAGSLTPLLDSRLLIELAPLDELGACDCAVDGCYRTIARDGETVWAYCASGLAAPRRMDPEELRQFRVEASVVCQKLRAANGLTGDAVTDYTRTVTFLGDARIEGHQVSLVLARCLRSRTAGPTLHAIRGRWPERSLVVLTPTLVALDPGLRADLKAAQLVVAAIPELIIDYASLELALGRAGEMLSWSPATGPSVVLRVDRARREASYQGASLALRRREFSFLVLLAEYAVRSPNGWVPREIIHDTLWPDSAPGARVYDRQIDQAARDVRRALDDIEPGSGQRVIETLRGTGLRLALPSRAISLI